MHYYINLRFNTGVPMKTLDGSVSELKSCCHTVTQQCHLHRNLVNFLGNAILACTYPHNSITPPGYNLLAI